MLQSGFQLPRWLFLALLFPLIFLDGWLLLKLVQALEPLVSTLLTALILSFLLDYPIRFLEKSGLSRNSATAAVILLALVIVSVLGFTLVPQILQQSRDLAILLPQWIESGRQQLIALSQSPFAQNLPVDLGSVATQTIDTVAAQIQSFSSRAVNVIFDTLGSVANLLATFVLTIFLVLNGGRVWQGVLSWLPSYWQEYLRTSLRQNFEQYFAGQATLAAILSGALMVIFIGLQIPYGLLFGLTIGMATFVPYASAISTTIVSALLAFRDVRSGVEVLLTAIVMGQVVDNVIAPRILGEVTGLNPVWLILSLLIGAKLGGILGLLIAVPVASFIKRTVDRLRSGESIEEALTNDDASPTV